MNDLKLLRDEIDKTDKELRQLLSKRFSLSEKIAECKIESKAPVFVPSREAEIIDIIKAEGLPYSNQIIPVVKNIMTISRSLQYGLIYKKDDNFTLPKEIENAETDGITGSKIGFCGDTGSYSEAAAKNLFYNSNLFAYDNFEEVCKKVHSGDMEFGVLPLENTSAGTVNDVYDYLIKYNLFIVKSENIPISHCLSGIGGVSLSDIKVVCSHPQALAQCSNFIKSMGYQTKEFENTAFATKFVKDNNDKSFAAISSAAAANENRLDILKENMNNESSNRTRFIALSKKLLVEKTADRMSIVFSLPHTSGSLSSVLSIFSSHNLNLLKIQSRPLKDKPWEYYFYLDFIVDNERDKAYNALYQLSEELPFCKFLGYYNEKNCSFA